jgi:hypothetical protein
MTYKPRLLVDFDKVIHRYSRGWADGTAYDPPMPGAKGGLYILEEQGYEIVIFSTRPAAQILEWLRKYDFPRYRVTNIKEPAVAILDDRAIRFTNWLQACKDVAELEPIKKENTDA